MQPMPKRAAIKVLRVGVPAMGAIALAAWCLGRLSAPWSWIGLGLLSAGVVGAGIGVIDMVWPGTNLLSRALQRMPEPHGGRIALTFDDGPLAPFTGRILDILDEHGVTATFFCIGHNVRRDPALAADIARRGHDVENHGDTHVLLPFCSRARIADEIARCADALERATGRRSRWLRCPKGYKSRRVQRLAAESGHRLIGFSYPVYDVGATSVDGLVSRTLDRARAGDILVLHDGHAPHRTGDRDVLVRALPAILTGLRQEGLEPVSLSRGLDGDPERKPAASSPRSPAPPPLDESTS